MIMIRQFSAGGVVYKKEGGQILFLICKSSDPVAKSPWCLPKGWLDDAADGIPGPRTLGKIKASPGEVEQAALREVQEEGGIEARVINRLGYEKYVYTDEQKQRIFKIVIFYLMEFVRDLPEGFGFETSEIKWADINEAKDLLKSRKGEYELIIKAAAFL